MPDEWYRDPRWDRRAQEDFELRLGRARAHMRAQYLRLKALALLEKGDRRERDAARDLLLRVLKDDNAEAFDLVVAHEALGELHAEAGALDEAESQYRTALHLALESNVDGDAYLRLPELLIRRGDASKLADAEELLSRIDWDDLWFSSQRFRYSVCRARLAASRGASEEASEFAAAALREAARESPDFPRHPGMGRVDADQGLLQEMEQLAGLD